MSSTFQILLAAILTAAFSSFYVGVLWCRREALMKSYGVAALLPLGLVIFAMPGTAVLWTMSLLPPLNSPESPMILGTGGAAYGLEYEYYASAALYLCLIPLPLFISLLAWPRRVKGGALPTTLRSILAGLLSVISRWGPWPLLILLFLALGISIGFFSAEGWSRFWDSPLGRFEGGSYNGALSIIARTLPIIIFGIGIFGALYIFVDRYVLLAAVVVAVSVLPLIIWESRGVSMVLSVALAAGWLRQKRIARWCTFPFVVLIVLSLYQLPLIMRSHPGSGLVKVGLAIQVLFGGGGMSVLELTIQTLQNLSQGFPVFVHFWADNATGSNVMDSMPFAYKFFAMAPTISAIDHWSYLYQPLNPRVNPFTPISTFSEMYLMHPMLPFVVMFVTVWSVLWVCKIINAFDQKGLLSSIVALVFCMALIQGSQYYTRTFFRSYYFTLLIGAGIIFWLACFKKKRRPLRNSVTRSRTLV
jgi:hypothetical protein